jgi:putative ABC transport system ATP-binding protein
MLHFEARDLWKNYRTGAGDPVCALGGVSLGVERGSLVVVTGPSGSGKTTLLALLGALERPTRGQALFDGKDLGRCSDVELARARRRLGFVFQDFSLIPSLSAGENVTYPLIPRGVPRAERARRAAGLLERLGMGPRLRARARELSGGEQQRVAIARALAGQPEALLADEPTSNLDPVAAQALLEVLKELHAEGKTILLASHDPRALPLATQAFELAGGKVRPGP